MQFSSFSEFFAMGGYGFYVWLSFGSCLLILLGLVFFSARGHRQTLKSIADQLGREQRIKQAQQGEVV
ncbi:heme exporter protein CcmD [Pseudoalteromonas tunicata]|uniref:heme exporter protein CcmD n=1 Tax=Pseudoalteromonas tunicata TaxID=314281 RepID=UPI00273F83BD|nr:heme exporter protein CcmD [Pseudoalteromonas tunicata]MDP4982565.1 heme exporter protein CcmD [Pseudoalteromonas tunicata]MDP5212409.1 heme exporter protein CcmD [Pseudoalteromonas tunicata]